MPLLRPLGLLTGVEFVSAVEHGDFVVEQGENGPVVRVINYVQRETVTLGVAADAVPTEGAVAAFRGARVPLTVDGWIGSLTPLAVTAALQGMAEGRSVSSILTSLLPTAPQMVELLAVELAGGETFLLAARPMGTGLGVFRLGSGDPVLVRHLADTEAAYLGGISALTSVRIGQETYVIAGSQAEDGITVLRMGAGGTLTPVAHLGTGQLVPVDQISVLRSVQVGGQTFVIAGASGSSSLTVFQMGAGGQMTVVDHVVDSLGTRFQGVRQMEVVEAGGRIFVLVAGADDGLTLFTLLPDGHLLHLETIEDTAALGLSNVTALEVVDVGGTLQVLALSGAEAGITALTLDLSSLGVVLQGAQAVLQGTDGDDVLRASAAVLSVQGGAGDDVLVDGAGRQDMTGGAGADIFVFTADGLTDTIRDFDVARDRIDLSLLPGFRSPTQVVFTPTATGGTLVFGTETIVIITSNGRPLTAAAVAAMTFGTEAMRFEVVPGAPEDPPEEPPPGRPRIAGTAGNDRLSGGAVGEDLEGGAGDDTLVGGGGDDRFFGGAGFDIASYEGVTAAITLDLSNPGASSPAVRDDLFDAIEGYAGTGLGDRMTGAAGPDWLDGGAGNDTLTGWGGNDTLIGGAGADVIAGGAGDNRLDGGAGADTISAEAGNDSLYGGDDADSLTAGEGNNRVEGGGGNDLISAGAGNDTLIGGDGNDRISAGAGRNLVAGGAGDDVLSAGAGDDTLRGEEGADTLEGGEGADLLEGAAGADSLVAGAGNDSLYGGDGRDILSGGEGNNLIEGGVGDDVISGEAGNDTVRAGEGHDFVLTNAGNDVVYGEGGNDVMFLGAGDDAIWGGAGDDNIGASSGNDTIHGEEGNDSLGGGDGTDQLFGGNGNDVMGSGPGPDTILGGAGDDTLSGEGGRDSLEGGDGNDNMAGSWDPDLIYGGAGNDSIGGGTGNDTIWAGDGNDQIGSGEDSDLVYGEAGDDFISGWSGADTLYGGTGRDTLNAGSGNDVIFGGSGADQFVFTAFAAGETDRIRDFEDGSDMIRLHGIPGATFAAKFAALSISQTVIDGQAGTRIMHNGHVILVSGVVPSQLTVQDFIFV